MLYPGVRVEGDHGEVAVVRDLVSDQVLGRLPHPLPHIRQGGGGLHDQDVLRQRFTDNIKPWDQTSLELILSAQLGKVRIVENNRFCASCPAENVVF